MKTITGEKTPEFRATPSGMPARGHPGDAPPRPPFHGWRVVATCFVCAVFAWGLGLFGASVYLKTLTALHGWSIARVSGAVTVFYLTSAAVSAWMGAQIDRRGARPVLLGGAIALGGGVMAIARIDSIAALYAAFMVLGVGWACLSSAALSATVAPWFDRHQGRATTIALMGASAGSILVVPLLLLAIERFGARSALIGTGCLTWALLVPLLVVALRHRRPEDIGQVRDGMPAPAAASAPGPAKPTMTRAQALREPAFWSVAIAFAIALMVQIGFLTHHVTLAAATLGAAGAGWLASATGVAALSGRLVLARVVDRVDVRRLAAAMMLVQGAGQAVIAAWPGHLPLVLGSLALGTSVGMVTTLSPVIVRREFGAAAFGAIYGVAATLIQFTSAFGPGLIGWLRDAFSSYRPGLAAAAALNAIAAIVLLSVRLPGSLRPPAAARSGASPAR